MTADNIINFTSSENILVGGRLSNKFILQLLNCEVKIIACAFQHLICINILLKNLMSDKENVIFKIR